MDPTGRIVLAVIIGTMLVLAMAFMLAMLLVVNASRRNRHRAELAELNAQRDLAVMQAEREATRQTLREVGQELHDNVGQLLTVAQLGINSVLEGPAPDSRLMDANEVLDQGIDELRRLGRSLNIGLWEKRSFCDAVQAEASRLERVARVKAHVLVNGPLPELPADTKTILFRVFQEIINNALRHGRADMIEIVLGDGRDLILSVSDNGRGFDPLNTTGHAGTNNIHQRCELIGLQAICETAPGKGCKWHIRSSPSHGTRSSTSGRPPHGP